MNRSFTKLAVIGGTILILLIVIGVFLFGPSFVRSQNYAFTRLMGIINEGDTRANVRWYYLRYRTSGMRLSVESPNVWRVNGRWQGTPASLIIRFSEDRVENVDLNLNLPEP